MKISAWLLEVHASLNLSISSFRFLAQLSFRKLFICHSYQFRITFCPSTRSKRNQYTNIVCINFHLLLPLTNSNLATQIRRVFKPVTRGKIVNVEGRRRSLKVYCTVSYLIIVWIVTECFALFQFIHISLPFPTAATNSIFRKVSCVFASSFMLYIKAKITDFLTLILLIPYFLSVRDVYFEDFYSIHGIILIWLNLPIASLIEENTIKTPSKVYNIFVN
jgi:hypothetical protein